MMRKPGFTLFEVVIALAVFAIGIVAVLTIYNHAVKAARQTKIEISLALLRNEIKTRTRLAAKNAFDAQGRSTFATSDWLLRDTTIPDDAGDPQPLDGANANPPAPDSIALNAQDWDAVKNRFNALCSNATWDDNAICAGFQFRMRTVMASEAENNQFTDIDGYDVWDSATGRLSPNIHSDEVQGSGTPAMSRTPVRPPDSAKAALPPGASNEGYFGPPRPSHGTAYDPRGMRHYLKRIKCVIGWDLANRGDIYSGRHETFHFTIYNPDARKQQP